MCGFIVVYGSWFNCAVVEGCLIDCYKIPPVILIALLIEMIY